MADSDTTPEPDYDPIREISRGGYGVVYLYRSRRLKEEMGEEYCAGKFIYAHFFDPSPGDEVGAYRRAFLGLQNFQTLAGRSEHLLRIHHVRHRHDEGYFCYMMELADDIESGRRIDPATYQPKTLKRLLESGGTRRRLPARECLEIAICLARGLRVLHDNNFIHRDVRPANIIFVNGSAKLADIDLLADAGASLTSYIPRDYAAPEGSHTERADLFSFGKTLYEMCMGLPVEAYPSLPSDLRTWSDHKLVVQLNQVIGKACAHSLRRRYRTAGELLEDLERIRDARPLRPGSRYLRPAMAVGAVLAGLIVAGEQVWRRPFGGTPAWTSEATSPVSVLRLPIGGARATVPTPRELDQARLAVQKDHPFPSANDPLEVRTRYATSLLEIASQAESPGVRFATLELARDIGAAVGEFECSLLACDRLEADFAIPPEEMNLMRARSLKALAQATPSAAVHSKIYEASVETGFRCLAMDDYGAAGEFAGIASGSAAIGGSAFAVYEARELADFVREGERGYERVHPSALRLRERPEDRQASLECGKYLCFQKNAWSAGLPMLSKGSEETFARLATRELQRPSSPADQVALGSLWWDLGKGADTSDRPYCLARAAYWYAKALGSQLSSADQAMAEERYQSYFKEFPPRQAILHLYINVEGGATIAIESDNIRIDNSFVVRNVHVNHWTWGTLPRGGPHVLENFGTHRFLPLGVDFARARISKKTISRRFGKILRFVPSRDRVELELNDAPRGSSDFDLEITF